MLLGVKAVIAESFERIHRSNLVNMGVLPLQFAPGESAGSLGLTGREVVCARRGGRGAIAARHGDGERHGREGPHPLLHGDRAHRHAGRARRLPARRHPAVRAPPAGVAEPDFLRRQGTRAGARVRPLRHRPGRTVSRAGVSRRLAASRLRGHDDLPRTVGPKAPRPSRPRSQRPLGRSSRQPSTTPIGRIRTSSAIPSAPSSPATPGATTTTSSSGSASMPCSTGCA